MSGTTRIIADLKAFAIQYLRNPFGAIFSIGFPLLLIVTFGAMFSPSDTPEVHLVIQDLDGTNLSREFIELMNQTAKDQTDTFETYMAKRTDDINEEGINGNELTGALVIPAGFEANALNNTSIDIILFADRSHRTYKVTVGAVDKTIETFEGNATVSDGVVGIETTNIDLEEFVFIDFFLPGIIALTIMLNCLMILSSLAAEYWQKGYFKILKTTPLTKSEWILSKLIWYLIIMAVSIFLMLAVGVGVFGANANLTPLAIALILAGILLFSSIGILIGALAKNSDTAAGIGNAVGQPMMFLSGIFWQLEDLPAVIQTISKVFPLTYLGAGLRETMIHGNDTDALGDLAVVVILAVVFFIIASRFISWKEK
jgi:ABC-2 type transport system permease protein